MLGRDEMLETIRGHGSTVLLPFSGGKDSLVSWLLLRDAGFRVVPFYMQMIPGLSFVERTLDYYQVWFEIHIYRVIYLNLYHWLRTHAWQPLERHAVLDMLDLPRFTYIDGNRGVSRTAGFAETLWCGVGIRLADSPIRKMSMLMQGPINL